MRQENVRSKAEDANGQTPLRRYNAARFFSRHTCVIVFCTFALRYLQARRAIKNQISAKIRNRLVSSIVKCALSVCESRSNHFKCDHVKIPSEGIRKGIPQMGFLLYEWCRFNSHPFSFFAAARLARWDAPPANRPFVWREERPQWDCAPHQTVLLR